MRTIILGFGVVLILGCQASVDAPATQLHGLWGGDQVEIRDSTPDHILHVKMACVGFEFPGPISVDPNGRFAATGTMRLGYDRNPLPVTMSGTVFPDSLTVDFDSRGELPRLHYSLKPRHYGVFTHGACLA